MPKAPVETADQNSAAPAESVVVSGEPNPLVSEKNITKSSSHAHDYL